MTTDPPASRQPRCPICGKPTAPASRPFCSPRCAQVDLGRWFGEQYRVPPPAERDDEEPAPEAG